MHTQFRQRTNQRQEILSKLIMCLRENLNVQFPPEVIHPDTSLFGSGLGLDSIDALEVVLSVEQRFGVSLDESNIQQMRSLNTLADSILAQQANNS
jgi:acyl carrier protein